MLSLQRLAGNRAVAQLMPATAPQPVVQRDDYNALDNSTIFATTSVGPTRIAMAGEIRADATTTVPIKAKLDFHEATVPMSRVTTGLFAGRRSVKVLEISVVEAEPRGRRIGQILTYHLGLEAQARKIDYILAANVTDAREPFYVPLGFRDVLDAPPWAALEAEKTSLDDYVRTNPDAPDFLERMARRQQIIELMKANQIYIGAGDLVANSRAKWAAQWRTG